MFIPWSRYFAFECSNNYFNLFFIALFKQGTLFGLKLQCTLVEIQCDQANDPSCGPNGIYTVSSCMTDLQLQLLVIFAAKQFAQKIGEAVIPLVKAMAQEKAHRLEYIVRKGNHSNHLNDAIRDVDAQFHRPVPTPGKIHVIQMLQCDPGVELF